MKNQELISSGYAPGGYVHKCRTCGEQFTADKRAWHCRRCAVLLVEKTKEVISAHSASVHSALVTTSRTLSGSSSLSRILEHAKDIESLLADITADIEKAILKEID